MGCALMADTKIIQVEQRKICWPNPDWCCLEGGCGYCNSGQWRSIAQIAFYAIKVGVKTYDDGRPSKDYPAAFRWGRDWGWPNTEQRTVPRRVKV